MSGKYLRNNNNGNEHIKNTDKTTKHNNKQPIDTHTLSTKRLSTASCQKELIANAMKAIESKFGTIGIGDGRFNVVRTGETTSTDDINSSSAKIKDISSNTSELLIAESKVNTKTVARPYRQHSARETAKILGEIADETLEEEMMLKAAERDGMISGAIILCVMLISVAIYVVSHRDTSELSLFEETLWTFMNLLSCAVAGGYHCLV